MCIPIHPIHVTQRQNFCDRYTSYCRRTFDDCILKIKAVAQKYVPTFFYCKRHKKQKTVSTQHIEPPILKATPKTLSIQHIEPPTLKVKQKTPSIVYPKASTLKATSKTLSFDPTLDVTLPIRVGGAFRSYK